MKKETYTREQFETMTAADVVCPLKRCNAQAGEPCTAGSARAPYTNGFYHAYRIRDVNRLKDAAFRFFDAFSTRLCEKCSTAVEFGPGAKTTGHVVLCPSCFVRELAKQTV